MLPKSQLGESIKRLEAPDGAFFKRNVESVVLRIRITNSPVRTFALICRASRCLLGNVVR